MSTTVEQQRSQQFAAERDRNRAEYLEPAESRPQSSARGLHHTALVSSDVEQTSASTGACWIPVDRVDREPGLSRFVALLLRHRQREPAGLLRLPGLDVGPYQEGLGGLHHIAISVAPATGNGCATG